MTSSLTGRAFVVTGGFGALGATVGDALGQAGGSVALVGRGRAPSPLPPGVLALPGVDLVRPG